jgi:hypothetical protein
MVYRVMRSKRRKSRLMRGGLRQRKRTLRQRKRTLRQRKRTLRQRKRTLRQRKRTLRQRKRTLKQRKKKIIGGADQSECAHMQTTTEHPDPNPEPCPTKKLYRKQAMKFHPDREKKNPDDCNEQAAQKFKDLQKICAHFVNQQTESDIYRAENAANIFANLPDKQKDKKNWQKLFPDIFTDFASSPSTSQTTSASSKKSATSPGNLHNLKPSFIYEITDATDATGATTLSMYLGPSRGVMGMDSFLRLNLAQEILRYRFDSNTKTFTDTNSKNFNIKLKINPANAYIDLEKGEGLQFLPCLPYQSEALQRYLYTIPTYGMYGNRFPVYITIKHPSGNSSLDYRSVLDTSLIYGVYRYGRKLFEGKTTEGQPIWSDEYTYNYISQHENLLKSYIEACEILTSELPKMTVSRPDVIVSGGVESKDNWLTEELIQRIEFVIIQEPDLYTKVKNANDITFIDISTSRFVDSFSSPLEILQTLKKYLHDATKKSYVDELITYITFLQEVTIKNKLNSYMNSNFKYELIDCTNEKSINKFTGINTFKSAYEGINYEELKRIYRGRKLTDTAQRTKNIQQCKTFDELYDQAKKSGKSESFYFVDTEGNVNTHFLQIDDSYNNDYCPKLTKQSNIFFVNSTQPTQKIKVIKKDMSTNQLSLEQATTVKYKLIDTDNSSNVFILNGNTEYKYKDKTESVIFDSLYNLVSNKIIKKSELYVTSFGSYFLKIKDNGEVYQISEDGQRQRKVEKIDL